MAEPRILEELLLRGLTAHPGHALLIRTYGEFLQSIQEYETSKIVTQFSLQIARDNGCPFSENDHLSDGTNDTSG